MHNATGRIIGITMARTIRPVALVLAAGLLTPLSTPASADSRVAAGVGGSSLSAFADDAPKELVPFYAAHSWAPLWVTPQGQIRPAVAALLREVEDARIDGLKPGKLKARDLEKALDRAADGDPQNLARVEFTASRIYVNFVKALRSAERAPMIYESEALAPAVPTTTSALEAAAAAPSLDGHVDAMGWMHPLYAPLRTALLSDIYSDSQRRQLAANLARVRGLPALANGRYVLVDAASQRLWMYDNGKPVDTMRVVVGKPDNQTPMMAGFLRYAILNPYWNVPDDLVAGRIARNVMDKGTGYLKASGYQVLDGWEDDAAVIDPGTIDWTAVAAGEQQVRVRQLPGGDNFMGRVKFMFPNAQGIYLHDTPEKQLMGKDTRTFSSGCVRLEDAPRLGRWLMGKPMPRKVVQPERRVELPQPVPVYITYLTVFPEKTGLAFRGDPYGRDGISQFALNGAPTQAR